ncbi:MAG: sulfite reductase, beta subunit [Rhodococcus erythropolis]|nr:sulfite reductase, beta subunit [Rhodococcus erythropolis]
MHDGLSDEGVSEAIRSLRTLAGLPGVVSWRVAESLDRRKGRIVLEDATFTDERVFSEFRAHPEHRAVAASMSDVADWWNGHYVAE